MTDEVTNCQECGAALDGWKCETFQKTESGDYRVIRTICHECRNREHRQLYETSGVVSTGYLMDSMLKRRPDMMAIAQEIETAAREFKRVVWFGGLQAMVREKNGHSWDHDPKLLALASAGRACVTLDGAESSLTLICAEDSDSPAMGIQGIYATKEQALGLIREAIALWNAGHRPKPDREVWFG